MVQINDLYQIKSSILKLLASITITLFCIVLFPSAVKAEDNQAAEVNADITLSNQGSISRMTDGSYNTKPHFIRRHNHNNFL